MNRPTAATRNFTSLRGDDRTAWEFDAPSLTKEARDHEHRLNGRQGQPQPPDSAIEGAALRQLLDVIEFLVEKVTGRHR